MEDLEQLKIERQVERIVDVLQENECFSFINTSIKVDNVAGVTHITLTLRGCEDDTRCEI